MSWHVFLAAKMFVCALSKCRVSAGRSVLQLCDVITAVQKEDAAHVFKIDPFTGALLGFLLIGPLNK